MGVPLYLTIYKGISLPNFLSPRQQFILYRKPGYGLKGYLPAVTDEGEWREVFEWADFIWVYKVDERYADFLGNRAIDVVEQGGVSLFRIRKTSVQ
jgi:hypothetical protein